MKFLMTTGLLILLPSTVSIANSTAQPEPRSRPSPQLNCVAVKPLAQSTTTPEQSQIQRSNPIQQDSECALNIQPQSDPVEPESLERDLVGFGTILLISNIFLIAIFQNLKQEN